MSGIDTTTWACRLWHLPQGEWSQGFLEMSTSLSKPFTPIQMCDHSSYEGPRTQGTRIPPRLFHYCSVTVDKSQSSLFWACGLPFSKPEFSPQENEEVVCPKRLELPLILPQSSQSRKLENLSSGLGDSGVCPTPLSGDSFALGETGALPTPHCYNIWRLRPACLCLSFLWFPSGRWVSEWPKPNQRVSVLGFLMKLLKKEVSFSWHC